MAHAPANELLNLIRRHAHVLRGAAAELDPFGLSVGGYCQA